VEGRFWRDLVTAITYWMAATARIRAAIGLNGLRTSIIRLDARLHVASTGFEVEGHCEQSLVNYKSSNPEHSEEHPEIVRSLAP